MNEPRKLDGNVPGWKSQSLTFILLSAEHGIRYANRVGEKRALLAARKDGDIFLVTWTGKFRTDLFYGDGLKIEE